MILNNNMTYLMKEYPLVWNSLKNLEEQGQSAVFTPIVTKSGLPSLFIEEQGKQIYLHSKYDPKNEAEQWMRQYEEEIKEKEHIFFYGIGFAYHIEYLMFKFPNKTFTLYEPNPAIFYIYLCKREMNEMPLKKMKYLFFQSESSIAATYLNLFINQQIDSFIIIPHPVYERVYEQQTKAFFDMFKDMLFGMRQSSVFTSAVKNLWTVNTVNNFVKVLNTPNILREKKNFLKGKPVLLVAAGPSLAEDMDQIRIIKEQGLAYIFAVGSANKALLAYGIYPDAVTSFDPLEHNVLVFDEIIQQQIDSIPLIFGTTIGYSTVDLYPGPKIHLIIDTDHTATYYLLQEKMFEKDEIIPSEVTISNVTLNLVEMLGCELVILAGQNFAFKGKQYYSEGIHYTYRNEGDLMREELAEIDLVESVEGKQISSMKSFTLSRLSMEQRLLKSKMKVINTTKGGAKIAGAEFMDLQEVIKQKLKQAVVDIDWYIMDKTNYNKQNLLHQVLEIDKHYKQMPDILGNFGKIVKKMNPIISDVNQKAQIEKLVKLNNEMIAQMYELERNSFYYAYIKIEMFDENTQLNKIAESVKFSKNLVEKIRINLNAQIHFMDVVARRLERNGEMFIQFQQYLLNYVQEAQK